MVDFGHERELQAERSCGPSVDVVFTAQSASQLQTASTNLLLLLEASTATLNTSNIPTDKAEHSFTTSLSSVPPPLITDRIGDRISDRNVNNSGLCRYTRPKRVSAPLTSRGRTVPTYDVVEQYVTKVIQQAHRHSGQQKNVLKPVDRRLRTLPRNWSRVSEIERSDRLRYECGRLIRGSQCCGRDCDMKFKNLGEFSRHADLLHDEMFRPYLCPERECPWSVVGFHERSECTRHIRTKHYQLMYRCSLPGCYKKYTRSDAFRRHVRQTHKGSAHIKEQVD